MEFEGIIIEQLDTKTGTNPTTGIEWKRVSYVAQTEERSPQTVVFDVWDGRDGRIQRLHLQAGMKYRLFLSFEAKKNKDGKWFNSISAWGARIIGENEGSNGEQDNQQ